MEQRQNEKAEAVYEKILTRTPGDKDLRTGYIDLLEQTENHKKALDQTRILVEQNKEDSDLAYRLARLHFRNNQSSQASEAIQAFLLLNENSEASHQRASRLYESNSELAKAENLYRSFLLKNPDQQMMKEALASFLYRNEKKEAAITLWKEIGENGDRNQVIRMVRALASRQENQPALEVLLTRKGEFQNDLTFLSLLCGLAIRIEQFEDSVPWALERLDLVQDPIDLKAAINDAYLILSRSNQLSEFLETQTAAEQSELSDQRRCLLSEFSQRSGDIEKADLLLRGEQSELILTQKIAIQKTREDCETAAKSTESLLEKSKTRKTVLLRDLVDLYRKAGLTKEALSVIPKWKTLSPSSVEPWIVQATLAQQGNDREHSLLILRQAARKFEDNATIQSELATAYSELGRNAEAKRILMNLYEESEKLTDKIRWVGRIAQIAQEEGQIDILLEQFHERQKSNRQSVPPLLALAEIYRYSGQFEERRTMLLEALRIQPRNVELALEIARIEEYEGNWKDAIKSLERAQAIQDSPSIRQRIAVLHLQEGDEEKGYQILNKLIDEIGNADTFVQFGDTLAGRLEFERLLDFITPLIQKYPNDYRMHYLRGIALEETGEIESAISSFCKCYRSIKRSQIRHLLRSLLMKS